MSLLALTLLVMVPGVIETVDSPDFPKSSQEAAVTATVRVANVTKGTEGSGAVVGRGGPFVYVLTANHVVEGAERLEVSTFSARSYPRPETVSSAADVLARSAEADLAVLRLAAPDPPPGCLRVCPPALVPGAGNVPALGVGCPEGAPTCVADVVRAKRRVRRPGAEGAASYWETERPVVKGRSGGPLLDRRGYLIGVAGGTNADRGYYSHPEEIHAFLRRNGLKWLYEDAQDK
jgi:S1-C subfamily serine protease